MIRFPTSYSLFFASKAAPPKAKAKKSKPLIIILSSICQVKSTEQISCRKKTKYFPSFVCLLHGERERAAVLKSSYNGANNPSPYLSISSTKLESIYIYVTVCINLPNSI